MAKCELCGVELKGVAYRIVLDGAEMLVCSRCARGKTVLGTVHLGMETSTHAAKPRPVIKSLPSTYEEIIVDGYGELIRKAREKMGLTRELLAVMVGEKESIIRRIEAEQLEPSIELARKLEKVLKIKLVERYEIDDEGYGRSSSLGGYDVTLGDIAEFKD
ncbi:MAG: multiprotein bridging factor aMBF1 [Infirmifilum sp.]